MRPRADVKARHRLALIAKSLEQVGTRFPALDALIERRTVGEIDETEFAGGVDRIIGNAEVTKAEIDEIRAASPRFSAHVVAQQLRLSKRTLAALEERCARLRDVEDMLLLELETDKIEQRVLPAYLFEFALRLQAAGVSQQEIRALSARKLDTDLEALSDLVAEKDAVSTNATRAPPETSTRDIVNDQEIAVEPLGRLAVALRDYEAVVRPATTASDHEARNMLLPKVDSLIDHKTDDRLLAMMIEQSYGYRDPTLFINEALPRYLAEIGVDLDARERAVWIFLVFVRHMKEVSKKVADELGLTDMVIPVADRDDLVWQIQYIDAPNG